ncbi:hypothetical protein Tco_1279431 [Tanacetum coccineum]
MEHTRKQQVPKEIITSSDTTALEEFDHKTTLFQVMTNSKSFNRSPKQRAIYHALMESILEDEDAMDKGVVDKLKKRKPDDADKDEGPSAGSDRGLKRQKTSKGTETSKKTFATKNSSKGKTLATASKSSKLGKSNNWYKKARSDPSPNPEWNEGKSIDDGPEQSPAYNRLKGTCKSYVELDYTMEVCYRAFSEQLDWNNPEGHRCPYDLTKPLPLRGGSNDKKYRASTTKSKAVRYELKGIEDMVPNLWILVKVVYDRYTLLGISHWQSKRQNFYAYTTKMVSKHDVYSTKRILSIFRVKVNKWYGYGYVDEIVVKRAYQKLYTFKEGDFKRLRLNDIEDMLLLIVQKKAQNLDTNVVVHFITPRVLGSFTTSIISLFIFSLGRICF